MTLKQLAALLYLRAVDRGVSASTRASFSRSGSAGPREIVAEVMRALLQDEGSLAHPSTRGPVRGRGLFARSRHAGVHSSVPQSTAYGRREARSGLLRTDPLSARQGANTHGHPSRTIFYRRQSEIGVRRRAARQSWMTQQGSCRSGPSPRSHWIAKARTSCRPIGSRCRLIAIMQVGIRSCAPPATPSTSRADRRVNVRRRSASSSVTTPTWREWRIAVELG